jgi:hypothetical protein
MSVIHINSGEKMILKKSLTLLLLAAFGLSAIAPALAATTISVNGGVLPYIAQDAGLKTNGAKPDVNVVNISFTADKFDLNLASFPLIDAQRSQIYYAQGSEDSDTPTAGKLLTGPSQNTADSSAYFLPPSGCKFVPLPGYKNPDIRTRSLLSLNGEGYLNSSIGEDSYENISVTNPNNLPGDDSSATYVFAAQVLKSTAYGNTTVPAGALAIHGFTDEPAPFNDGGPVTLTVKNIGLACDATNFPTTSGNLEMTYVMPNANGVKSLFVTLSPGAKIPIATYTARAGKLEALVTGDTVGRTNGVPEDSQSNTLVSNTALSTVTSVKFGPGEVTGVINTTTAAVDIDAILIRAAEVPGATSSAQFFETPFATAQFNYTKSFSSDSVELADADLANSDLFDNVSNALITVDLEITSFTGDTSSATLTVSNAFVGLETTMPSRSKSANNPPFNNKVGGYNEASLPGFLGAVAFDQYTYYQQQNSVLNNLTSIISVDPSSASGNHVVDGRPMEDNAILTAVTGFVERPALIPDQTYAGTVVDVDDFVSAPISNSTTLVFTDSKLVNPDRAFLFPGVFIDNELNNVAGIDVNTQITDITARSATSVVFRVTPKPGGINVTGGQAFRNSRTVFSNLSPASASSGAQYHIVFGSSGTYNPNGPEDNTAKDEVQLGRTAIDDYLYSYDYEVIRTELEESVDDYDNNVILASKLTSTVTGKKFTVHILPFINKYDAERDVISVRPKGTITLNPAALTEGVKLIAKVYGNNLNGTKTLTLASIAPSGPVTSNIVTRILPVSGDDKLMVHTTGTPALGRDTITVSQVDGDTTADDTIEDIIGSGKALDTTVPPLFGGGVAGNALTGAAARGPIPFIQPKGRVLAIEEAASGDFRTINDIGTNARVRITLPAGTDLNLYGNSATAHQNYDDVLAIFGTGGFNTPISVANNITNVQKASSTTGQAFIDIDLPTTSNPAVAIKRGLYLVFKPDALVVPKGLTNLNASVSIVDVGATAAVTDDKTLVTVGTVALAPALSNFLSVAFSQTANSRYRSTGVSPANEAFVRPLVETKYGSQATSFTTPISKVVRFVNNDGTPDQNNLWDIVISEGVADAFPVGTNADGYPSTYINGAVTKTEVLLHCLLSNPAIIDDVAAQTATVLVSDSSIVPGTLAKETGVDNGFILPLTAGTLSGAPRAVDTKSTVTVSGIKLETTGNLELTDTDIACWTEVDATAGASAGEIAVIGSPVGRSIGINALITDILNIERFPLPTNVDAVADLLATQRLAGSTADASDTAFDTNSVATDKTTLARSVFNTSYQDTSALISKGIGFIRDDISTNAKLLNSSTEVAVTIADLPPVNGTAVTGVDKQLTLSVPAGTLEPGTLITASTTSPATESVIVPVLDNGSFKAVLRSSPTAVLTLTQTPVTNKAGASSQIKVVDLSVVKNDPKFNGVVPTLLNSTIAKRGTVVALFNTPAVTGFDFADVEDTARVNGVDVTKIATGKYAAIVRATASTYTLTVIVDDKLVTTTLNLATVTAFGQVLPAIGTINIKADDTVVVNLLNARASFPSDLSFEIVYTDGTTAVVANSAVTFRKAGARARFANPQPTKTIAFVQAVSTGGSRAQSLFY